MADGPFFRFLTVLADGTEIASGCHLQLTGSDSLSLRPGFFLLQAFRQRALSPLQWTAENKQRRMNTPCHEFWQGV